MLIFALYAGLITLSVRLVIWFGSSFLRDFRSARKARYEKK